MGVTRLSPRSANRESRIGYCCRRLVVSSLPDCSTAVMADRKLELRGALVRGHADETDSKSSAIVQMKTASTKASESTSSSTTRRRVSSARSGRRRCVESGARPDAPFPAGISPPQHLLRHPFSLQVSSNFRTARRAGSACWAFLLRFKG